MDFIISAGVFMSGFFVGAILLATIAVVIYMKEHKHNEPCD